MATPLTELTKKDVEYWWTERQQKVFQQLKDTCAKEPVLLNFKTGQPTQIKTDTSDQAVGACLCQQADVTTQGWEPLIYRQSGRGPGKRTPWKSSDQPTRGHVTVETHTGVSTHDA